MFLSFDLSGSILAAYSCFFASNSVVPECNTDNSFKLCKIDGPSFDKSNYDFDAYQNLLHAEVELDLETHLVYEDELEHSDKEQNMAFHLIFYMFCSSSVALLGIASLNDQGLLQGLSWPGLVSIACVYQVFGLVFACPILITLLGKLQGSFTNRIIPIFRQFQFQALLMFYIGIAALYVYGTFNVWKDIHLFKSFICVTMMWLSYILLLPLLKAILHKQPPPGLLNLVRENVKVYNTINNAKLILKHQYTRIYAIFLCFVFLLIPITSFHKGSKLRDLHKELSIPAFGYGIDSKGRKFFINSNYSGKGKWFRNKNTIYTGEFKSAKFHGTGHIIHSLDKKCKCGGFEYKGDFINGLRHGFGERKWFKTGSIYTGEYKESKQTGKGKLVYGPKSKSPGVIYEGNWKSDEYHGFGILTSEKEIKKGLWENGKLIKKQ
jgi:hypothetical protein